MAVIVFKKKQKQIAGKFSTRFFGLDPVCYFYETYTLYKKKALRELFQKWYLKP